MYSMGISSYERYCMKKLAKACHIEQNRYGNLP